MKKIILSQHTTLDSFVAGPNGEMDWIHLDEELFDLVGSFTSSADTALYGRKTFEMMDSYWPTAGDQPNASKHDRVHSAWYQAADKIVLSKSLKQQEGSKTIFLSEDIPGAINKLKQQKGGNILMFGSPTAAHSLMENNLIDEYWMFINPVVLGRGIPLFSANMEKTNLKLLSSQVFPCGVVGLHYAVES